MVKILLTRIFKGPDYTIGKLYIDGEYLCDTMEPTVRDLENEDKVWGKTAIPEGTYKVDLTYSFRFKRLLPILLDVPYFEGIRIHSGNVPRDTEGCILVGKNIKKGMVLNSRKYEKLIVETITDEDCTIEIR